MNRTIRNVLAATAVAAFSTTVAVAEAHAEDRWTERPRAEGATAPATGERTLDAAKRAGAPEQIAVGDDA